MWRWKHLRPFFGHIPVINVTTDAIEKYKQQRRAEVAAKATVNRELATLRRMFHYGKQSTPPTVHNLPYIRLFSEKDNVRKGFVEQADFERIASEAVKEGLWLRALIEIAYTYGWRRGELLELRARQVDQYNRTIRLDPGTTKNYEGREVYMTNRVCELLHALCDGKQPDDHVFTRDNGKPIRDFRGTWRNLCVRAGTGRWECRACKASLSNGAKKCSQCGGGRKYAGLIPHDFRRSAAKALRRAGVPESVIMATGGWKTASMFRRYAIVSSADQQAAMRALEQARQQSSPNFTTHDQNSSLGNIEQKVQRIQ